MICLQVIYFSTDIFTNAGLTGQTPQYATLGMGGMNVLMTLVSLIIIEKAGRKTLQLIGLGGMLIDVILLTICLLFKVSTLSLETNQLIAHNLNQSSSHSASFRHLFLPCFSHIDSELLKFQMALTCRSFIRMRLVVD